MKPLTRKMSWARVATTSLIDERVRIADCGNRNEERVEIVVIVFAFGVMARRARAQIILGRRADAKQDIGADRAFARGRDFDRARHGPSDLGLERFKLILADQIDLIEHDEVGAHKLILIDLLERIVVV